MNRNLKQILRVIAKAKNNKNVEQWVNNVLNSAVINFNTNLTLTSNPKIPFVKCRALSMPQ